MKVKGEKQKQEYTPYGEEWEAELMKWRKADLVNFLAETVKELSDKKELLQQKALQINVLESDKKTAEENFNKELDVISNRLAQIDYNMNEVSVIGLSHAERNGVDKVNHSTVKSIMQFIKKSKQDGVFHDLPF